MPIKYMLSSGVFGYPGFHTFLPNITQQNVVKLMFSAIFDTKRTEFEDHLSLKFK
jgi:hypothetical protein